MEARDRCIIAGGFLRLSGGTLSVAMRMLDGFPVVDAVFSGIVTAPELDRAARSLVDFAREHGTDLFLADLTDIDGGHGVLDLFEVIRLLESFGVGPGFREAIVLPTRSASADDARFFETAARNRGLNVRVFPSREEATAWLVQGRTP